ncbi:DUF6300 family protein [Streptomyces sp. NPDC091217]|uniref:DUF6300 family protein n=1 Tax=Streptomyces sp. NPDC091217 TaxID=3365975 RepID=UPI00380B9D38
MSGERDGEERVLVKVEETPPCPQCAGATLLLAQFPYGWTNNRGENVAGIRETVLCPCCHHGDPAAAELLALYAVDEKVTPENLDVFGGLVAAWVESVRQRTVDEESLNTEFELWQRGEL